MRLVKKYHRQHITIWGIICDKNNALRKYYPAVVNFYSASQILKIYALFLTGLLPFVHVRHGVVDIPLATQALYKTAIQFMDMGKSAFGRVFFGFLFRALGLFNFLSRFWIPHLKKRGILTFYFTLNQESDFEIAIKSGCSGIMTDYPTRLNKYLKNNSLFY